VCEPNRKKRWDDVTVRGWIPARLCTNLDLFARKLNMTWRQALQTVICSALAEDEFLRDLFATATLLFRVDSRLLLVFRPTHTRAVLWVEE